MIVAVYVIWDSPIVFYLKPNCFQKKTLIANFRAADAKRLL